MPIAAQPARPLTRDDALEAVRAGATLVTGNDRLARALRQAYDAQRRRAGETAWPSARIHSWGVWVDRLWRDLLYRSHEPLPTRLTADQELILWERAIAHDPGHSNLLALDATAEEAQAAARLAVEWRLDRLKLETSESEDVQSFLRWRRKVERRCLEGGWTTAPGAVDALIERADELPEGEVLLAGFDELNPQQQDLLDAVRRAGGAVREVGPGSLGSREAVRVELESRREELRAAARWAKRLADNGAEGKIGVVLPDLGARRQQVERAFLEAFDSPSLFLGGAADGPGFTISVGLPLDRYALVCGALLSLELYPDGTDLSTFGAWLRCDSIAGGAAERTARGLLDRRLRQNGVARIRIRKLGKLLEDAPALRRALGRWSLRHRRLPDRQSPPRWAESFARLLEALGWPGEGALSSEGRQVLAKWNELLSSFAALGAVAGEWDLRTATRTLRRMARSTPFQPETPDAQVEVMSLFESAGAEAEHLWVAGLDDESWPAAQTPNPFLPIAVQREACLPQSSPQRTLEFARLETQRLLSSARRAVVSHARAEEDRELRPSPLIADLSTAPVDQGEPSLVRQIWDSARIEKLADSSGPPLPLGEERSGGANIFAHQAHCPFRAFAQLRLGAREMDSASPGLAPWERGHLVHEALERIWEELAGSEGLHGRNPGDLRQTVAAGVDYAVEQLVAKRREPLPRRFESVERLRLEALLLEWLELEKSRQDEFRVVEREERKTVEIGGVKAEVRIDRVDELADGRRLVVDYKTGEVKASEWDRERPLEPQLPLYAISQGERLGGALFARLSVKKLAFEGAVAPDIRLDSTGKNNDPELGERVAQWRRNLEALAADYLAGRAEVDPRDGKCRYCKLPALCRKDEVHDAD